MAARPDTTSASERLIALARVSSLLRGEVSARDAMQAALAAAPHIIPADAYAIWRHDKRSAEWRIVASAGLSQEYAEYGVTEHGAQAIPDAPFVVENVFASALVEERRAFYEREGVRSLLVLPVQIEGKTGGSITCYFRTPRPVSDEDLSLGSVLANVLSSALSARRFDRFAEAARVVSGEHDLSLIVQTVTDAATELSGAHFGAFFYNVINADGGAYMLYSISGVPREAFERFPMPRATAVFAPTFQGSGIVRSANIRKDPRYGHNAPYNGMPEGHLPVTSYLAVPVISRSGEVIGGLFFGHPDEGVFTESEEQIVEALAGQAAVAVDNARLYEALQRERERLVRSELRYRALVTATPSRQAIWTTTPEGEIIDDLAAWRDITGQSVEEIRGLGWVDALHPKDRQRVVEAWRLAVERREVFREHYRLRVRDGSYRWFSSTGAPVFDNNGNVFEWVGTAVDVDERRTADENLRFLARASDLLASSLEHEATLTTLAQLAVPEIADWCAVDVIDDDGNIRRLAVAHVDPAKVELALDLRRRFPPNPETDTVTRVIRTAKPEWMSEFPESMLDEAPLPHEYREALRALGIMSFMVVPLRAHDRVLGAVTLVLSESRRRFSEGDLAFAEELGRRAAVAIENARLFSAAQAANRAKDDFLATLSHELRTPMTAVVGWSRMLKMGLDSAETEEAIDAIERSASVQMQLIEDILDMSRIMAGKMRIDAVRVDLGAVVHAALATVHPAASAKGIEILTSLPRHAPQVLGDHGRLQQIVWNLLANAIKFTGRGGEITLRLSDAENGLVRLSVGDTGEGIDPAFLPHVFERFRQQDSSTTRAHGGIGLGLTIVRHLVELHGGRITAESAGLGHGATFTVELPVIDSPRAAETTPRAVDGEMPSLAGTAVLVIDDEPMTRDVVAAILRRAKATVVAVDSVRAAHDALREFRPDVILCDIAMPGEDGYAFVSALRARSDELARLPVVALTAFGRAEDRDRALSSGFDAYLKKPIDPLLLAATLRNLK